MLKYVYSVAVLVGLTGVCHAQSQLGNGSFVGSTQAGDGCPAVTLHIIRSGTSLKGVVFRSDGTGTSNASGQIIDGKISLTMTPASGDGPRGEIAGTVSSNGLLQIHSVQNPQCKLEASLHQIPEFAQGGG